MPGEGSGAGGKVADVARPAEPGVDQAGAVEAGQQLDALALQRVELAGVGVERLDQSRPQRAERGLHVGGPRHDRAELHELAHESVLALEVEVALGERLGEGRDLATERGDGIGAGLAAASSPPGPEPPLRSAAVPPPARLAAAPASPPPGVSSAPLRRAAMMAMMSARTYRRWPPALRYEGSTPSSLQRRTVLRLTPSSAATSQTRSQSAPPPAVVSSVLSCHVLTLSAAGPERLTKVSLSKSQGPRRLPGRQGSSTPPPEAPARLERPPALAARADR